MPAESPLVRRLEEERVLAERALLAELQRWKESAVSVEWKAQLGL